VSEVRLKRLFESVSGGSWGTEPEEGEVTLPCIRGTDFDYPALRSTIATAPVRGFSHHEVAKRAARRGDLIIEKSGGGEKQPVGRVVLHDFDDLVMPTNFASRLKPSEANESRFLTYLMSSLYAGGTTKSSIKQTTGIQNLDVQSFLDTVVFQPSLPEQQAIADFLDSETARIDALIEKKRRLVERLNLRLSVEHERLVLGQDQVQESSTNGGFYGATAWPETALRHLSCEVQTGPFGSQLHADDYVKDGWPVVNPSNIVAGRIIALPEVTIDDESRTRLARHSLKPGDIVFGRRGEMGRAGLVSEQETGWICGTGSLRLRLTGDLLLPEYLKLLLETGAAKRYFQLSSVGSTMENLNTEILLALPVLVPPINEQKRVVNVVSRSRAHNLKLETKLNKSINLLTEHRQALITAAVTGQVEVPGAAAS
jgi:type I restriction enzyme S subunit